MAAVAQAMTLAFVLSATDKMSRIVDQSIKKSSQSLSSFERKWASAGGKMMQFGGKLTAAGAAIGGSIVGMAKSTADYGNIAAKTGRSVGMDAESFQKLAYAAKYAGVDQQKLAASMGKLNKNIVAAASGSKTAQQTFKDLGINLKDSAGNLRAPNEILADIADVFKDTKNGAGKTALAYELLGKSGADMISLLNGGSEGIAAMGKEAEEAGMVISNDAAKACEDFCDNLDRVKDSAKGVMFQLGASMMPTINETAIKIKEVIKKVTEWLRENPELAATIGKVVLGLGALIGTVGIASVVFGGLTFIIGKFAGVFRMVTSAIKVGQAIITACKNSMLLFRVQYAAFTVGSKLAAAGQWLFNTALFGCPIVWIIAGIMAVIAAVVLMVKYWDKIAAFFNKIWNAVIGVFAKAGNRIKNLFLNYTPTGLVIKHWNRIVDFFANLWNRVKSVFRITWDWIKNLFLNYTPTGLVIKHWDRLVDFFANIWNSIKTGITNAWESIGTYFGNLGSRFYEWGQNILQGLWNGIMSMANKVVEGIQNIGQKIAKGFKAIFGINSPSKLFAEYGLNITQGLVVGLNDGGSSVEHATEGLAAHTTDGITQSLQTTSVDASKTFASTTGTTLNYSPQITIAGNMTPEVRDEFSKMLRQHANEIISIIRRDAENTARLSFD